MAEEVWKQYIYGEGDDTPRSSITRSPANVRSQVQYIRKGSRIFMLVLDEPGLIVAVARGSRTEVWVYQRRSESAAE